MLSLDQIVPKYVVYLKAHGKKLSVSGESVEHKLDIHFNINCWECYDEGVIGGVEPWDSERPCICTV